MSRPFQHWDDERLDRALERLLAGESPEALADRIAAQL